MWTRDDFESSLYVLVKVLQEEVDHSRITTTTLETPTTINSSDTAGSSSNCCQLLNWQVEQYPIYPNNHCHYSPSLYLLHPPVDRMTIAVSASSASTSTSAPCCVNNPSDKSVLNHSTTLNTHKKIPNNNGDDDEYDDSKEEDVVDDEEEDSWLEDEMIQFDPDCTAAITTTTSRSIQSHNGENYNNNNNNKKTMMTQWKFSIVYSDTWNVPILYFTVQWNDTGSPCTRTEILQLLLLLNHNNEEGGNENDFYDDNGWDFISQEEHPITGWPSFFLHPCQTEARLSLLLLQQQQQQGENEEDDDDEEEKEEEKQEEKEEDEEVTPNNKESHILYRSNGSMILWSYMAMLFPVVGYSIPSRCFQRVQMTLKKKQKAKQNKIRLRVEKREKTQ